MLGPPGLAVSRAFVGRRPLETRSPSPISCLHQESMRERSVVWPQLSALLSQPSNVVPARALGKCITASKHCERVKCDESRSSRYVDYPRLPAKRLAVLRRHWMPNSLFVRPKRSTILRRFAWSSAASCLVNSVVALLPAHSSVCVVGSLFATRGLQVVGFRLPCRRALKLQTKAAP